MKKRSANKIEAKVIAAKRSDVEDHSGVTAVKSNPMLPPLPAQTVCMLHWNHIAVADTVKVTVEANIPNYCKKASTVIEVCKNTACHKCNMPLRTGDTVVSTGYSTQPMHVGCSKYGHDEKTVRCVCHDRDVSQCHAFHVDFGHKEVDVDFICDTTVCPECGKGFATLDKVEYVDDKTVYHRNCTVPCAEATCCEVAPKSNKEYIVCTRHKIICNECGEDCSALNQQVAVTDVTDEEERMAFFFLCVACLETNKSSSMVVPPKIFCSDPECAKIHIRLIDVPVENSTEKHAAACAKATCSNCKRFITKPTGLGRKSYFVDDNKFACADCFTACIFCKKTLLRQKPTPQYTGTCAVASGFGVAGDACPHHATMTCQKCFRPILTGKGTGKYYHDVNKWLHYTCY